MQIKSAIRTYKIYFGGILSENFQSNICTGDIIIIDKNVYNSLKDDLRELIDTYTIIKIEAHEKTKSFDGIKPIINQIIKSNFKKNNRLICIGGGITQDITSFISSIFFRGVKWIFFPTTLLAQGDSCIGGKSSINIGNYKNQLGNFYPPEKIFIAPSFLYSLSKIDFISGMGEILHFHLISGREDFNFYRENFQKTMENENSILKLIKRTLEIKKQFIERDEFDTGERLLLNYGHSFGHALESITNYKIPHGVAVSFGMDIANFISVKLNFMDIKEKNEIRNQLKQIWEGIILPKININKFEKILSRDKKNINNKYRLILSQGIGKMFIKDIEPSLEFNAYLKEYFYKK